jgi:hypothetical protein
VHAAPSEPEEQLQPSPGAPTALHTAQQQHQVSSTNLPHQYRLAQGASASPEHVRHWARQGQLGW